jgi:hypothetical protein
MNKKLDPVIRPPRELISAFGGRLSVAEITGASPNSVSNWYTAGIPGRFS